MPGLAPVRSLFRADDWLPANVLVHTGEHVYVVPVVCERGADDIAIYPEPTVTLSSDDGEPVHLGFDLTRWRVQHIGLGIELPMYAPDQASARQAVRALTAAQERGELRIAQDEDLQNWAVDWCTTSGGRAELIPTILTLRSSL
ncbi:hypothetical protein SUDANB95_07953 (plasmid) [Actinosynnema sp. ALI-1.44]